MGIRLIIVLNTTDSLIETNPSSLFTKMFPFQYAVTMSEMHTNYCKEILKKEIGSKLDGRTMSFSVFNFRL